MQHLHGTYYTGHEPRHPPRPTHMKRLRGRSSTAAYANGSRSPPRSPRVTHSIPPCAACTVRIDCTPHGRQSPHTARTQAPTQSKVGTRSKSGLRGDPRLGSMVENVSTGGAAGSLAAGQGLSSATMPLRALQQVKGDRTTPSTVPERTSTYERDRNEPGSEMIRRSRAVYNVPIPIARSGLSTRR